MPTCKAVAEAMFDPFEYFVLRHKDGLLKTDFKRPLGKVSYHIPCHSRVQNIGRKTEEMLKMVPDTTVNTVERCSGHDGTWGVKNEYYDAVDENRQAGVQGHGRRTNPTTSVPTAPSPAATSLQGMSEAGAPPGASADAVRMAYGLDDAPLSSAPRTHDVARIAITTWRTACIDDQITRDSLLTLEAYAKARTDCAPKSSRTRSCARVHLGEHMTLLFEDELTIRYQIQEMLRVEKIFEEDGIRDEMEAYEPLVPTAATSRPRC